MHIFHSWKELIIRTEGDVKKYKACPACGLIKKWNIVSYDDFGGVMGWKNIDGVKERYLVLKCWFEGPPEPFQRIEVPTYVLTPAQADGIAVEGE